MTSSSLSQEVKNRMLIEIRLKIKNLKFCISIYFVVKDDVQTGYPHLCLNIDLKKFNKSVKVLNKPNYKFNKGSVRKNEVLDFSQVYAPPLSKESIN